MLIFINSVSKDIPKDINTIERLVEFLGTPRQGTGIALNGHLIPSREWISTPIHDEDRLTVISATYGG